METFATRENFSHANGALEAELSASPVLLTRGVPGPVAPEKSTSWHTEPPYQHSEWIVCEVIHLMCFFVALYILYALIHFYIVQQSRHIYSGHSSGSRWLEKMCILAVVCAILRFTNNQLLLFTGWHTRERCSILLNISIALYFLTIYPVYLFLWIRQRIFYSNRALKHLYNRVIRFISWATIFCFFVLTGISMVLFVVDRKNSASGRVCGDQHHHHSPDGLINIDVSHNITKSLGPGQKNESYKQPEVGLKVNTITGLLGGAIQTSFLILFLYPIMDNKLRAVRNLNMRCHHSLLKLIRRAFVLSGVCIFSDVAIAFGVKGVHRLFPKAVFALVAMYDVNLIINILCIVATFRRWRRMLFPCLFECCGATLINQSTKTYYLQRRSTTGLNGSNVESMKLSPKKVPETNKSEFWEIKVQKAPIVDVLLLSDGEESEKEDKSQKGKKTAEGDKVKEQDCTSKEKLSHFPPIAFSRKSLKRCYYPRRNTASGNERPSRIIPNGTPIYSTSRCSLRAKKANNVVTTKFVLKSEALMVLDDLVKE